jgi:hypothetical protein
MKMKSDNYTHRFGKNIGKKVKEQVNRLLLLDQKRERA